MSKFVIFLVVVTLAACSANLFDEIVPHMSDFKDDDQLKPFVSMLSEGPGLLGDCEESSFSVQHSETIVNGVKQEDSTHTKEYKNDNGVKTFKEIDS